MRSIKSVTIKPWIYVPKAETSEISEQILSLVARHPSWGPKKIAGSLVIEGTCLSSYSIYKFFVKHNLNKVSLRNAWKDNEDNQKELKS